MDFYIESAKFKDEKLHDSNATNELKFKRINVFVGANNSGKTQILKDLLKKFGFNPTKQDDVLLNRDSIKTVHPNNDDDFILKCHLDVEKGNPSHHFFIMPPDFNTTNINSHVPLITYKNAFREESSFDSMLSLVGSSLCTYLSSDYRLQLINPVDKISDKSQGGGLKTIYDGILNSSNPDKIIKNIDKWFFSISKTHTYLTNFVSGGVTFRYNLKKSDLKDVNSVNRQNEIIKNYRPMSEQGDGMRALLSLLCGIYSNEKPIIFIDEPEAFLHPGQAYLLGRYLSQIIDDNHQVFISTHSADFLRGLFLSAYDDVTITRLFRYPDDTIDWYKLDEEMLDAFSRDEISSAYNILDGLFHSGCVVTEGNKDVLVYQTIIDKIDLSSDIHVFATTGMGGVTKATQLYRTMHVRHAIILDCDSLLNGNQKKDDPRYPVLGIFKEYSTSQIEVQNLNDLLDKFNAPFKYKIDENGNDIGIDGEERSDFKMNLQQSLDSHNNRDLFDKINLIINGYGIFITQEGQLEAWFSNDKSVQSEYAKYKDISKDKKYEIVADAVYKKTPDELAKSPLGIFIKQLTNFINK